MVANGKNDGPLEGQTKGAKALAMRQSIGHDGHHHAGDDAEQSESGPQPDGREGLPSAGQGIDHAAEQHRLGQLHGGNGNAGERHPDGKPTFHCQQ